MPGGVAILRRWDVDPPGVQLRGIRYLTRSAAATADFRSGPGRGVRRVGLHQALIDAAQNAGVNIDSGRVADLRQDERGVSVGGVRARYVVAADGLHSSIRTELGIPFTASGPRRWGIRQHFACDPWTDYVEVHWAPEAEAYVTPVGPSCVNVAILTTVRGSFDEQLMAFPELRNRLGATAVDRPRAAGPLLHRVSDQVAGRVLLVGDAAGYVDALTGEGLSIAFACAEAAALRIVEDRPELYRRDYLRISRRYRLITTGLLLATRHARVRRRIVPAAQRLPGVFDFAVTQLAKEPAVQAVTRFSRASASNGALPSASLSK